MKTKRLLQTSLVLFALTAVTANAAVIGLYDFGPDNPGSGTPSDAFFPSSVAAGVSFNDINRGASSIADGGFFTSITTAGGQPSRILASQTTSGATSLADAVTADSYFEFTITPDVGQSIDFNSITLEAARGGGSNRGLGVASSADDYATFLPDTLPVTGIETQEDVYTNYAVDVTSLTQITGAVTFRVYLWSGAVTNTIYLDNITADGVISPIPEPSTYAAIFGVGVLGLAILRRLRNR